MFINSAIYGVLLQQPEQTNGEGSWFFRSSCPCWIPSSGTPILLYTGFITAFRSKGFQFPKRKTGLKFSFYALKTSCPGRPARRSASTDESRSPLLPHLSVWTCSWVGDGGKKEGEEGRHRCRPRVSSKNVFP